MKDFEVEITDYGYDGEGVGHLDGKVVFVPYLLKGERALCRATKEKSSFIQAKVVKVCKQSPLRQTPSCPYFGRCGGCGYQHIDYGCELEIKRQILARQLAKVGYVGQIEVVPSPKEYGYRNKLRLFVGEGGLSLKMRGSDKLVPIERCLLVSGPMNEAIFKINNFIKNQNLCGVYSEVVLREECGQILINFHVKTPKEVNYQGLFLVVGDCGIFETFRGQTTHKMGLTQLICKEMGLNCRFSPKSFHQVNTFLTENLYKKVIESLLGDNIANCYSGAGVLSGVIAKSGKNVVGIELGESEHCDAENLKKENNLSTLTNICGDCGQVLQDIKLNFDTIIVDPPRAGMAESVCQSINQSGVQRVVYVSCNSATLIRDIARLNCYSLQNAILFDMFARTGEYEVLCILTRQA